MKGFKYLVLIFIMISCVKKEELVEYYPNGKVKIKGELLDGKRHGVFLEYYNTGKLKFKETWDNGQVNCPFEEYSPHGNIHKKGIVKNNVLVEETYFFESGVIEKIQEYDEDGYISTVRRYKENGVRDSTAYPHLEVRNVRLGDTAILKSRLVNVLSQGSPQFDTGALIITSGFVSTTSGDIPKDTIATIYSKDGLTFDYKFKPTHVGENILYGQYVFKKNRGKTSTVTVHQFSTSFSVLK